MHVSGDGEDVSGEDVSGFVRRKTEKTNGEDVSGFAYLIFALSPLSQPSADTFQLLAPLDVRV
jgi:hypothetical protein